MPIHDGGSGGGRSSNNGTRYYAVGDTYMTNTMPISDFNNDPYRTWESLRDMDNLAAEASPGVVVVAAVLVKLDMME